jgi:hypothetical protein
MLQLHKTFPHKNPNNNTVPHMNTNKPQNTSKENEHTDILLLTLCFITSAAAGYALAHLLPL